MLLEIVKFPDPLLRQVSQSVEVEEIHSKEFQSLLENMFETMYTAPGIGLAAVQIGVLKRVMVLDLGIEEGEVIEREPRVIINPQFTQQEGSIIWEEGCLSCPELVVPMKRFQKISVEGLDQEAKPFSLQAEDLLAVALQHEIDHMDGKLIIDQLSHLKRSRYKDKIQKGKIAIR
ncbi:MAG: peptide deformylase [Deltaproteobacteria bacterium]|nr:peptide deformylase [Deltaproteobacteria bacterium]